MVEKHGDITFSQEAETNAALGFLFHPLQSPSPQNKCSRILGGSPLLTEPSLKTLSGTAREVSLLADSNHGLADRNKPSHLRIPFIKEGTQGELLLLFFSPSVVNSSSKEGR